MMAMELDSHFSFSIPKEKPNMKKLMTFALALSFLTAVAVPTAFGQDEPKKKKGKKKGGTSTRTPQATQAIS
jgi:hypothetical protein